MSSQPSFWRKMWFRSWFKSFRPTRAQKKYTRQPARRSLQLEHLEGRTLLSGVTVTTSTTALPADHSAIVIQGTGFDPIVANNSVQFTDGSATEAGTVTAATATTLTVAFAPTFIGGELDAVVTSDSTSSASTQVAAITPVVTASTDNLGAHVDAITINGYGFDPTSANDGVVFTSAGNQITGTITDATPTTLSVTLPSDPTAGSMTATVTTNLESSADTQVATVTPVVTSTTTNSVAANATQVTIAGYGFDTGGTNTVVFNDGAVAGLVTVNSATSLTVALATDPTTAGPLTAAVTTDGAASGLPLQVATIDPVVTGGSPGSLAANATTLTIDGFGFDTTVGNDSVTFDHNAVGTVTSATATTLTVTFTTDPSIAGSLTAQVSVGLLPSGAGVPVTTVDPAVTASTASLPVNATSIVISGYGFDTTMAHDAVVFNASGTPITGTITNATANALTVTIPSDPPVGVLTAKVTTDTEPSAEVQVATVAPVVLANTGYLLPANASSVTIIGIGFDGTTASHNTVTFNDGAVAGTVTSASSTSLTVNLATDPATAGPLTAVVTSDSVSSGTAIQVAKVTPVVSSGTPASLPANASAITINGVGFDPNAANDTVTFNDGASGTVTAATATSLTVAFGDDPAAAGPLTAQVSVNATGGAASSGTPVQVSTVTPVVTSSTANLNANATTLTIDGYGFNATTPSDNTVAFSGAAVGTVTATNVAGTTLTVTFATPPTAGPLTATVTTNGQSGSSVQVATVLPVVLSNVSYKPTAAATTLLINGYGFDTTAANDSVNLSDGAVVGSIAATSANLLTLTLSTPPTTAGALTAVVTTNAASSAPVQVATVTPVVTSSSTSQPAGSATLTIAGHGFDPTAGSNTVVFTDGTGTATGTVTAATPTSLTVTYGTTPTVAGPLTAVVTTDSATSGLPIQVATVAPAVTSSSANLAANAATLVIDGTDFDSVPGNNTVTFVDGAGTAVGTVTAASATSLTVKFSTMPTAVGSLTAVVTTDGVSSGTAVQVATVVPAVTSSPANLAASASTIVIHGSDFDTSGTNTVAFNDGAVASGVVVNSSTSLTVTFSTKPTAGSLTAVVTTDGNSSGTPVQVASVAPAVTPNSAFSLAANASTLTIAGTGFDPAGANTVVFNDGAAGTVTAATATSLTVTFSTDPTTAGPLTAVVTTDGAGSGTAVQVATVAPVVTVSTANLAANASSLTISGYGFDGTASHDTVLFSDGAVGAVTGATANSLTVSLLADPAAVANLTATVTTDGVQGTSTQVAAVTPVVLSNSGYQLAANASAVIINGFGFDTTAAHNTVVFNDGAVAGTITSASATSLTVSFATKPVTAGSLTAVVTTDAATSGSAVQVAAVAPFVTSSTASLAANAATLTISGYGFDPTASGNTVTFNGAAAGTVTAATTTSLTVTFTTPPVTGNLTAVVHSLGVSSGTPVQVATVAPAVTLSVAALAASSSTITINGDGFDTAGTNTVALSNGAVVSGVTANSATSLTVTFSTKPTAGNLTAVVTTDGQTSGAAVQVATVTPVVTSSVGSLLASAATITISGYGFDPTAAHNSVTFSGAATGIVTAATAASLTVTFSTAPTGGNLTAIVTTNGASSASVQVATVAPVVTISTANQAINATSVTINGFGFSTTPASNTVTFNDGATTGSVSLATATSLIVTFGTKPTGLGSLTATVGVGGATSASAQVATVTPVVTAATTNSLTTSASQVTINGFGFDASGTNTVAFNDGAVGTVTAVTANALTVTFSTKPSAGNLTAVVTTDTVSSGSPVQVATVAPVVTASTANLAYNATTITITGSGFDPTPANNTVLFSDGAAGTVIGATATALTVQVTTYPATAGAVTAVVTTNGVASGSVQVATVAPVVTSSTVDLATNGATLVINGYGFDPTATHNTVVFTDGSGTAVGTVSAATPTSLTVTFGTKPTVTGSLTAVVTTDSQSSGSAVQVAAVVASLGSAPTVTSSTANLAANAATITISGTNFTTTYANNTVVFSNGAVGAVTGGNATSLTVTFSTPPTAGSLTAVVTTEGVSSGTAVQVATVTPVVTSSTANQAINSGTLTINGYGFDPTTAHNTVTFNNGAVGTVSAATATQLTVTLGTKPTATGALNATVTTDSAAGSATQVATVVPVVTSSTANSAINATSVTINGFGFSTTATSNTVTFNDGATAGSISSATANSLTVTFGTKPTGLGSLTATVGVGGATSASAQVATVTPVVTQNTANLAASATTLTISGFGFDTTPRNNTVVFSNGAVGVVTGATATSLTVTFAVAPSAGNLTATVTTDGVSSGTAVQVATVTPVVTRSNASLAANAATLTINGFGFSTTLANNTVLLNGTAAGSVTAATATQLTVNFATTSKLTGGALTAVVTTNSAGSGTAVQVATVTPVVTSSVANLAINAGTLTISGYGFDPTPGNNTITFNHGAIDGITAATATSLTVTFSTNPTAVGSLTASVTTDGASSGGAVQVATVTPAVTSSTASLAPTASGITVSGFGFDTVGLNTVTFSNGAVASGVTATTGNSVTFTFSTKPTAGNLTATVTANGESSASVQVATVAPVVTMSAADLTALTATQILISGAGFDPTPGNNTVVFSNGAVGTVTAVNVAKTQLTVSFTGTGDKKPTSTGAMTATVTTNGVSSGVGVQVATVV